eukprot:scaffold285385_cov19-Tisochrysis_lutea.AAC.3
MQHRPQLLQQQQQQRGSNQPCSCRWKVVRVRCLWARARPSCIAAAIAAVHSGALMVSPEASAEAKKA